MTFTPTHRIVGGPKTIEVEQEPLGTFYRTISGDTLADDLTILGLTVEPIIRPTDVLPTKPPGAWATVELDDDILTGRFYAFAGEQLLREGSGHMADLDEVTAVTLVSPADVARVITWKDRAEVAILPFGSVVIDASGGSCARSSNCWFDRDGCMCSDPRDWPESDFPVRVLHEGQA